METPVQVDFQGEKPNEHIRQSVMDHIGQLEKRFGRITACRVAVAAPSRHHHSGGQYAVSIHLTLPDGREVNVARREKPDARYADAGSAVNDAFKRPRRLLDDAVQKMRGEVKLHETRAPGIAEEGAG